MCDIKSHFRKFAVLPEQTHSLNVGIAESLTDYLQDTDAVITFKHNLPIGVVTADCVPIVVYTPAVG
ncbi:MAG: laccase domain-containing protein, partial [Paramuribaculum sp.]|nr:laccase domain-containing protein [Paramuribaculum sp.]